MRETSYIDVTDPSTGELLGQVEDAGTERVDEVLGRAREGFSRWTRVLPSERASLLRSVAAKIMAEKKVLAQMLTREVGKPEPQAEKEVASAVEVLDYYAGEALRVPGEMPQSVGPGERVLIDRVPVGVVAAITPFNYPLATLACKLGPALAAGCSVVAKPDEHTPFSTIELMQLAQDAGLDPGVFQVVNGTGERTGMALVRSPKVDLVAFTGSRDAGKKIMAQAAGTVKRLVLELGGQCPAIVLRRAPWRESLGAIVHQCFNNSGQYCYRINRIFVEKGEYEPFVEGLVAAAGSLKVGPVAEPGVDLGPLRKMDILEKAQLHVRDALENRGELLLGGERLAGGSYERGLFFPPTVIGRASPKMLVMSEETFGPVVGVMEVNDAKEATSLADATPYGLAAYVFSEDPSEGLKIAESLRVGSVWVNRIHQAYIFAPFGGMGESGLGREKSRFGLEEYLELKTIYFHY